ncbi:Thg1-domain-containing protein [Decorospora gaudefroyi]|uniref:tRNA(His) guanylyltransferase n=1 Tax=Decorospora gaudefroyi TaxID=184978 RepID=A0A6A5K4E3_9PLEO|nr:Thg1-domain-containing protein [Decorospora gaudefroyi]
MANSKYEYVRLFEQPDTLLANTWVVVRIDGRGFSKLTAKYEFVKPNDKNGLDVMNAAAEAVMKELPDLVLAFGNSDEYSFVFHKDCALFERRASKLTTTIVSTFTSYYVYSWSRYFPDKPLTPPLPSFDGRAVCYPSDTNIRDYLSWRQVDCHINNLYNTTFWTLVQQGGMGAREAEQRLKGTVSSDKNEILFKEFGINYNNEPECFKKGTVLYRDFFPTPPANEPSSPMLADFPSPPIAQPVPKRRVFHRTSRSIEQAIPYLQETIGPLDYPDPCARPTFLSTTSTPSPPPSPPTMSSSAFPNALRSNPISPRDSRAQPASSMPLSPPWTATTTWGNTAPSSHKQPLPSLTPLPLSPPTLKPSTKPPLSLNPPNPTTRRNFSPTIPQNDFPADFPISGYKHHTVPSPNRTGSHSASASLTTSYPSQVPPRELKQRSPSQPSLPTYFASSGTSGPPNIPLRISSIPANSKPRKLSLPIHRSMSTLRARNSSEEKENLRTSSPGVGSTPPRRVSPPIRKNKALPSPPVTTEDEIRARDKVSGTKTWQQQQQQEWSMQASAQQRTSSSQVPSDENPGTTQMNTVPHKDMMAPLRLPHSEPPPPTSSSPSTAAAPKSQPYPTTQPFPSATPPPPLRDVSSALPKVSSSSKTRKTNKDDSKKKSGGRMTKSGGWAAAGMATNEGRPVQMSRTQRDKERKKRNRAAVIMEHVDIIKDEFWEKRPWILSGRMGTGTG